MIIKRIDGATRVLGAPKDWDGKEPCNALPILDVPTEQGNFMVSAWEPTPDELELLKQGASVRLWIRGQAHPVVALDVGHTPLA